MVDFPEERLHGPAYPLSDAHLRRCGFPRIVTYDQVLMEAAPSVGSSMSDNNLFVNPFARLAENSVAQAFTRGEWREGLTRPEVHKVFEIARALVADGTWEGGATVDRGEVRPEVVAHALTQLGLKVRHGSTNEGGEITEHLLAYL